MRRALLKLHLYVGLAPALFLAMTAVSGALIMLEGRLLPPAMVVEMHQVEMVGERVSVAAVLDELERRYGRRPDRLTIRDAALPDQYRLSAGTPEGAREETVLVDPYTGEVIETTQDFRTPLSRTLRNFHLELLAGPVGGRLVGGATALLLIVASSGMILLVSSLNKVGARVLNLRWNGNGRSWNYRFHHALALVMSPIILAIAVSGVYLAFEPVQRVMSAVLERAPAQTAEEDPPSMASGGSRTVPLDALFAKHRVHEDLSEWRSVRVVFPTGQHDVLRVERSASREGAASVLHIDRHSGEVVTVAEARSEGRGLRSMMRALHLGTAFGVWTEALWFLACLSVPMLAVSGAAIWWTRTMGSRRTARDQLPLEQ